MRYYSILFYLLISLLFVGCGESNQTEQGKIYLPYLQKEQATQTPVPSPSATPTIVPTLTPTPLPTPTSTRPANPYHPIVKHYIDVGYLGAIGLNTQNNTAYVRNEFETILPVRDGIPDLEHALSVPPARGKIIVDELRERIYVLAERAIGEIVQGVSVFDLDEQFLGFVPFGGSTREMILEPNQGWVYVYGIPDPHLNRDDEGILMILDGTTVIEKVDPWDIRVFKSAVDPSTGHVYFASQYDRPDDVHDSESPYGRIDIYAGTERIKTHDRLFSNISTIVYQPKHQTLNVYTTHYQVTTPYDTTVFHNAEIISQTSTFSRTLNGAIPAGTVYTPTGELYLTDRENVGIMSDEIVPQLKKGIKLSGTPGGFENIIVDPFSGNIYLNNWYDGTLTIIHNEEIIGKMWLNRDLNSMVVNPKNGDLYLSTGHAGRIWILGFDEQTVFPKDP